MQLSIKYITTIVQAYNNIQQRKNDNGFCEQYTYHLMIMKVFSGTFVDSGNVHNIRKRSRCLIKFLWFLKASLSNKTENT